MQFSWGSLLFLFAAFQAILFLIGLWQRPSIHSMGRIMLSVLLANISLVLVHHGILMTMPEGSPNFYAFNGLATASWFAVPPALFLYIRSLTEQNFKWKRSYWWLFSLSFYNLITWLLSWAGLYIGIYWFFNDPEFYIYCWVAAYLIVGFSFGVLAYDRLKSQNFTARLERRISWLRWYLLSFNSAMLLSLITLIALAIMGRYSLVFEYSILAVFGAFSLLLVHQAFHYSPYFAWLTNGSYGNAGDQQQLSHIAARIDQYLLKERAYLQADLSLADLSRSTGIGLSKLSQVFTQYHKTNFYTYINRYRLKAFEKRIHTTDAQQFTISAIATECGFKSKTSLYKVFREKHGTTPSVYLKEMGPLPPENF